MINTYTPTNGMLHVAKEGLGFVENGKVSSNGIPVEVPEYSKKIAAGDDIDIKDATEIFSHLLNNMSQRRPGWDNPENLTNERIVWQLQGGCQAFKWSHDIVQQGIDDGIIKAESIPNYITPEEFISSGRCY